MVHLCVERLHLVTASQTGAEVERPQRNKPRMPASAPAHTRQRSTCPAWCSYRPAGGGLKTHSSTLHGATRVLHLLTAGQRQGCVSWTRELLPCLCGNVLCICKVFASCLHAIRDNTSRLVLWRPMPAAAAALSQCSNLRLAIVPAALPCPPAA